MPLIAANRDGERDIPDLGPDLVRLLPGADILCGLPRARRCLALAANLSPLLVAGHRQQYYQSRQAACLRCWSPG